MIYTSLSIPPWLRNGVQPHVGGASARKYIYGGDTETLDGAPMTFQFFSEHPAVSVLIWLDDPAKATRALFKWCRSLAAHAEHVVYVHNLEFDMVSFFWNVKEHLVTATGGEFDFHCDGWRVSGVYGAPTFARLTDNSRRTVLLVDSYSYYRASLAKAAEVFCPHLPKLTRPEGLGERQFTPRDANFASYAMRDAEVAYHIGVSLETLHNEFDLRQTVSVADMAARIFRRQFLDRPIPHPDRAITDAALSSYHGGKNNVAVPAGWHPRVTSLDISSAYPFAMSGLPSFSVASAYRRFNGTKVQSVPDLGVYKVTGKAAPCLWPSLFAHDFAKLSGHISDVYVCGYELNEALRSGEFLPLSVQGWMYDADADPHPPPLHAFVRDFYRRKEAEQDKGRRAMYKFFLNSLSGKFIQTRKRDRHTHIDIDSGQVGQASTLMAGGMFHPFIASLITGHTRATIHRLEHKYKALHTATDGIFTRAQGVKSIGKGLGSLVCEAHGDLLMLRNKLYVLYGPATGKRGELASSVFEGKCILKHALHGFVGTIADLEMMVVQNRRLYKTTRVNRLRTSINRGLKPNRFAARGYALAVGRLPVFD